MNPHYNVFSAVITVTEMMENLFQTESFEDVSEKRSDLVFLQNAGLQPDPLV